TNCRAPKYLKLKHRGVRPMRTPMSIANPSSLSLSHPIALAHPIVIVAKHSSTLVTDPLGESPSSNTRLSNENDRRTALPLLGSSLNCPSCPPIFPIFPPLELLVILPA